MFIPKDIREIQKAFTDAGKKLFVVGGAIRDFVLKKEPKDFDLATNATPDEIIEIGEKNNFHVVDKFRKFGRVDLNGNEVVTFRRDIGSTRNLDSVEFATIEDDVNRRDLTINALFYDLEKNKIVDLVGGLHDLKNNIVRTVGNPVDRFNEDPIRKLRTLRFYGAMGGTLADETYQALKDDPSIDVVSKENIKTEFIKGLVKSKSVKKYLDLVYDLNFIEQIFPNLEVSEDYPEEKDPYILIAYLLKDNNPKLIEKELNQLKYTTEEIRKIVFFISLYHFDLDKLLVLKEDQKIAKISDDEIRRFGSHIGDNFNRFINFKPTIKFSDVPTDLNLKGKAIRDWILNKEKERYQQINEFKKILKKLIR